MLTGSPESPLSPRYAQSVHQITRQPEGNFLGDGHELSLVEGNPQVDVYQLGSGLVQQDVLDMSVSQAHDVADYTGGGEGARVVALLGVPGG